MTSAPAAAFWDSPAWLYAALDGADRAFLITDAAGLTRHANAGVTRYLGYSPDELIGGPPAAVFAGADPNAFFAKARSGEPDEFEVVAVRKDGSRFPALVSVSAIRDPAEAVAGFLCIVRDLTREAAEVSRLEAEEQFRDLFENASDLIQSIDPTGRILYVNTAWRRALGYSDAELAGLTIQK